MIRITNLARIDHAVAAGGARLAGRIADQTVRTIRRDGTFAAAGYGRSAEIGVTTAFAGTATR